MTGHLQFIKNIIFNVSKLQIGTQLNSMFINVKKTSSMTQWCIYEYNMHLMIHFCISKQRKRIS